MRSCYFVTVLIITVILNAIISYIYTLEKPVTTDNSAFSDCVLVIDAGHGGEDGGAISCTGRPESQINLEIACRLNDFMCFLGWETVMIRSTDISIYTTGLTLSEKKISDLRERVRIVNSLDNCVLVSIHQNNFSDSRYNGAQVFYAPTDGSKSLASVIQKTFKETINPESTRNIKPADGIYLMQNINVPGVLIECGFLSNATEEALLRNTAYQKSVCCVIGSAFTRYMKDAIIT